jgi:hypothetical protein
MRVLLFAPSLAIVALISATCAADPLPRFPPNAVWYQDVSAPSMKHPNSDNMINHLSSLGGWGTGATKLQLDFSFYVLHAATNTATKPVVPFPDADDYYYPDCGDFHTPLQAPKPLPIPLPAGGGIEGTGPPYVGTMPSYTCDNGNNDCHMLIVQGNTLFESGNTNVTSTNVQASCALTWDLTKVYPRQGRGEQCTSTDAAGYPVAPLLISPGDMAAAGSTGDLGHAIRFILPNARMKDAAYVHPANHGTKSPNGASDENVNAVPYGSRFRLSASFNIDAFVAGNASDGGAAATASAKVILRTLQKYGMVLSDGGSVPLSAESDYYYPAGQKWSDFGMDPNTQSGAQVLEGLQVTDFEVVYTGPQIALTFDCVPTPYDFIFIDGYDF